MDLRLGDDELLGLWKKPCGGLGGAPDGEVAEDPIRVGPRLCAAIASVTGPEWRRKKGLRKPGGPAMERKGVTRRLTAGEPLKHEAEHPSFAVDQGWGEPLWLVICRVDEGVNAFERQGFLLCTPNGLEICGAPLWGSRPASRRKYRAGAKHLAGRVGR